jgi:hypothetical protein
MASSQIACIICGGNVIHSRPYLKGLYSSSLLRELAYAVPVGISVAAKKLIPFLRKRIDPVLINKKFFSGSACYCPSCNTGWYQPRFDPLVLSSYYKSFYWSARAVKESNIAPDSQSSMPSFESLSRALDRIAWLRTHASFFNSVLDFGAGDCAASWVFKYIVGIDKVVVSDLSESVQETAKTYALSSASLDEVNDIGLAYSSHSIEHVSDFIGAMRAISESLTPGGYIFIETPNIASLQIFNSLVHTPHTFMLSIDSFGHLPASLGLEVLKAEAVGPPWRLARPFIVDNARADLRVLLRKVA